MTTPTNSQQESNRAINPFLGLLAVGGIVASIWIWNHLSFDTQDYITDDILPILLVVLVLAGGLWLASWDAPQSG